MKWIGTTEIFRTKEGFEASFVSHFELSFDLDVLFDTTAVDCPPVCVLFTKGRFPLSKTNKI